MTRLAPGLGSDTFYHVDYRNFRITGIGLIVACSAVLLSATMSGGGTVSESHLIYAGGVPRAPTLDVKIKDSKHRFHVTIRPRFKNMGHEPGRIDRVTVTPVGFEQAPYEIRVIYLDRSEIGWREEKEVRCEFLVVLDSKAVGQKKSLEFRANFYDQKDNEIHWEGIVIETIPGAQAPGKPARYNEPERYGSAALRRQVCSFASVCP